IRGRRNPVFLGGQEPRVEVAHPLLGRSSPGESLMRSAFIVKGKPGTDLVAELIDGVPGACPDELELEGFDDALGDGVSGGTSDGSEGMEESPGSAEILAVAAGVLGSVVG